jgi:glyoxylase-like metal-dependent hydrolase (beta-lactamase superfamily II)
MSITYSNRRDFMRAVIGGAAGLTFTYSAFGQAAPDPIKATKLTDKIVLFSGDGGNVAVIIADDGLLQVDGGFANRATELQKSIAEVDSHKVSTLFSTHWHGDHVGSNELLGKSGVKIMGHENTKKRLSMKINFEAFGTVVEPLKPEGLPTEVFTKGGKMTFGKEKIEYVHVPLAHTDGDAYLFFPGSNILHTGDLYFSGMYPVIDFSTGGWVGGMANALDVLLKVGDARTRIIPGHGPLSTKDDMKASRDMLHMLHDRLETLSKQGKSADEVVASKPTKDIDAKWGKGVLNPDTAVKLAYTSIGRHNQKT